MLRAEGDGKWIVCFILGHGRDGDVFWVGEIRLGAAVDITEELGYFAYPVRAVVEEEESIIIW